MSEARNRITRRKMNQRDLSPPHPPRTSTGPDYGSQFRHRLGLCPGVGRPGIRSATGKQSGDGAVSHSRGIVRHVRHRCPTALYGSLTRGSCPRTVRLLHKRESGDRDSDQQRRYFLLQRRHRNRRLPTRTMTGLHMTTPTLLCHYFGAAMKQRGHGHILNMASMAATFAVPGIAVYAASKSYLKIFSKALYNELYDYGVSVTVLCPGAVDTDLYGYGTPPPPTGGPTGNTDATRTTGPRRDCGPCFTANAASCRVQSTDCSCSFLRCSPSPLVRWIKRHARFYRYGKQI